MNVGIIVHSKTGNTYSVAEVISKKLTSAGHNVKIQRVTAEDDGQIDAKLIKLKDIPGIEGCDMLILGAPVRGFNLSPVMKAYLSRFTTLNEIKLFLFVTEQFPFKWMGGTHSIKQFTNLCSSKGGKILGTGIINWSSKNRNDQIKNLAEIAGKL